jgi:hypothetical protein
MEPILVKILYSKTCICLALISTCMSLTLTHNYVPIETNSGTLGGLCMPAERGLPVVALRLKQAARVRCLYLIGCVGCVALRYA